MFIIPEHDEDLMLVDLGNILFDEIEMRKKLGDYRKMRFEMRTKENGHNEAHIHVSYNGKEVTISINSGDVLDGTIPEHKMTQAQKWVMDNRIELAQKWREIFGERGLRELVVLN